MPPLHKWVQNVSVDETIGWTKERAKKNKKTKTKNMFTVNMLIRRTLNVSVALWPGNDDRDYDMNILHLASNQLIHEN